MTLPKITPQTSKAKTCSNMELEVNGVEMIVSAIPFWQRYCVIPNGGDLKGFRIVRVRDGAMIAWSKTKTKAQHGVKTLELLEELTEESVRMMRKELAE